MPPLPSGQHILSCVNGHPEYVIKINSMAKTVKEIHLTSPEVCLSINESDPCNMKWWQMSTCPVKQQTRLLLHGFISNQLALKCITVFTSDLTPLCLTFSFPLTLATACKNANKVKFKHTPEYQICLHRLKMKNSKHNPDLKQPLARVKPHVNSFTFYFTLTFVIKVCFWNTFLITLSCAHFQKPLLIMLISRPFPSWPTQI